MDFEEDREEYFVPFGVEPSFYEKTLLARYQRNIALNLPPLFRERDPYDPNYGRYLSTDWIPYKSREWDEYQAIPKEERHAHLEFYELTSDAKTVFLRLFYRWWARFLFWIGYYDPSELADYRRERNRIVTNREHARAAAAEKANKEREQKIAAEVEARRRMAAAHNKAMEDRRRDAERAEELRIQAEALEVERLKIFPDWLRNWARTNYGLKTFADLAGLVDWIVIILTTAERELNNKLTIKKIYKLLRDSIFAPKPSCKTEAFYVALAQLLVKHNYAENRLGQAGNVIDREALFYFKKIQDLCRVSQE